MDNREDNHKSRVFNWKQTMCSRMALGLRRDGSPIIAEGERGLVDGAFPCDSYHE